LSRSKQMARMGGLITGLYVLGSGLWALGSGLWALGSGLWALGAGLFILSYGYGALVRRRQGAPPWPPSVLFILASCQSPAPRAQCPAPSNGGKAARDILPQILDVLE